MEENREQVPAEDTPMIELHKVDTVMAYAARIASESVSATAVTPSTRPPLVSSCPAFSSAPATNTPSATEVGIEIG